MIERVTDLADQLWTLVVNLELTTQISLVAVLVGLPAATYYPFMFLRIQWYKSQIGRSMLSKGIALAAIFWAAILGLLAAAYGWEWFAWVKVVINCLLVFAVWYQVTTMRKVQRSGEAANRMGLKEGEEYGRNSAAV